MIFSRTEVVRSSDLLWREALALEVSDWGPMVWHSSWKNHVESNINCKRTKSRTFCRPAAEDVIEGK